MPRDLSKLMPPDLVDSQCTECGAQVPAEFGSCDALFMSILTPLGMRGEESPEAAARVHAWAKEVWEAHASQHELARGCIKKAMGE